MAWVRWQARIATDPAVAARPMTASREPPSRGTSSLTIDRDPFES